MSAPILVTFCANPACRGWGACDRIAPQPLAGLSDSIDRSQVDDATILALFAQELALAPCSDDDGVRRLVPPGSEFTIHIGTDEHTGKSLCTAIYTGPAQTKAEMLAGSPEWSGEKAQERLAELKAA